MSRHTLHSHGGHKKDVSVGAGVGRVSRKKTAKAANVHAGRIRHPTTKSKRIRNANQRAVAKHKRTTRRATGHRAARRLH